MTQQTQEQDKPRPRQIWAAAAAFESWLTRAYRQPQEHYTAHNMQVAFAGGAEWQAASAQAVPTVVTEEMHVAACKVLLRASGMAGLPQRMLDAMRAAAPQPEAQAAPLKERVLETIGAKQAFDAWMKFDAPECNDARTLAFAAWQASAALDAKQAVQMPEPTYKLRIRGRLHDHTPGLPAFDLPDGEHKLYAEQQVRAMLATQGACNPPCNQGAKSGAGALTSGVGPEVAAAIDRFDAYFRSANGVPPNARISVPTAEWQVLRAMLDAPDLKREIPASAAPAAPVLQPLTDEKILSRPWSGYNPGTEGYDLDVARFVERTHGIGVTNAD